MSPPVDGEGVICGIKVYFCVWQRLSPDCEDQIRVILQESALDYRLDPQLQIQCAEEVCCSPLSL